MGMVWEPLRSRLNRRMITQPRERGRVRLQRDRVFILPTTHGLTFGLVVLAMLLGALNYGNSLAFALTFMLIGLGLVALLHTYRNLRALEIRAAVTQPVFAGQPHRLAVQLTAPPGRPRRDVHLALRDRSRHTVVDVPPEGHGQGTLELPPAVRGRHPLPLLRTETCYPLGLFRAWAWVDPGGEYVVYPAPEPAPPPPSGAEEGTGEARQPAAGQEDFAGLRAYRRGDPPRHIAWKTVARGQGLHTKEFVGSAGQALWLDWSATAALSTEARLSRLCRWALDAQARGQSYGLSLPTGRLPLGQGDRHLGRCLRALALYPEGPT